MKALVRGQKKLLNVILNKHFKKIQDYIKDKKYDYFLLIKGEVVPENFILDFKKNNPTAKLIYYTYDASNNNSKNGLYIQKFFDTCYSIDFNDVKENPNLKLKHLFYSKDFVQQESEKTKNRKYDISFVGTLHSNRYEVMQKTFSKFKKSYLFLFSQAKWWFIYNKLINKEYKNIKMSTISFTKLNLSEVANIFKSSNSVLDIQRYGQAGLTMRTFEVLASGAILVTTNENIKKAEFYDEDKIVFISDEEITEEKVKIIESKIEINNYDSSKLEKYFVNNWVKEFFT